MRRYEDDKLDIIDSLYRLLINLCVFIAHSSLVVLLHVVIGLHKHSRLRFIFSYTFIQQIIGRFSRHHKFSEDF